MSLWGGGLWGASAGAGAAGGWTEVLSIDYTSVASADWSGNGTFTVGGVDHVVTGGSAAATLGPDGSTGLRIVQNGTGAPPSGPKVAIAFADISADITDGDDLLLDVLYSLSGTPASNGRFFVGHGEGTDVLLAGPVYYTTPGGWEWQLFYGVNNDTDDGTALSATTGAGMTVRMGSKYIAFWDRSTQSTFPDAPAASDQDSQIGSPIGASEAGVTPALTDSDLLICTGKALSGANVDVTIHGIRLRRRGTA